MYFYFNSFPFHERRHRNGGVFEVTDMFKSTPFSRRETSAAVRWLLPPGCLNPLPSHEGRPKEKWTSGLTGMFKSTPFSRRETAELMAPYHLVKFKSTPFSRRETCSRGRSLWHNRCLNPLPSHEGRQLYALPCPLARMFKSTPFSRRETSSAFIFLYSQSV